MRRAPLVVILPVVLTAIVAAALLLPHSASELREAVLDVGPAAPLVALLAWVLLTPAAVPLPLMAAASGLAFGAVGGAAVAVCGAVAGGVAAFMIARVAARERVEHWVRGRPRLADLHGLIAQRGFAAVLAARVMPGLPVAPVHYVSGVAPVGVLAFAAAMAIGAILRLAPYAVLGEGITSGSTTSLVVGGMSMAIGATTAFLLVRHLRATASPSAP
jgi:uncharacterized membrane protein YdjX (TVP38/TMEM64 family)